MNLIYYHLLKVGTCKLWAVSWIQPPPVFGNKVLLENSHAHSLMYCLWLFSCFYCHYSEKPTVEISTFERDQLACKSVNYLLFDPLKKRLANPWSNIKSSEDAMNLYCFHKVDQSGENFTSDSPYFMCSRLLCDFLRTGKRDFYMLLPYPSAPGSYSPIEQQSGRGCNNSISSRDWNWQWKEKRGNCPSFNGWVSWETHSCHMEHVPSSLKEMRKEKP